MCDPISIGAATAGLSGATEILKFTGQNRAWDDNRHAAGRTYASQFNAAEDQRVQVQAQTSEDTVSNLIEQLNQRGRISASAADLGVDASTATQQLNASEFAAGRTQAITDLNAANQGQAYKTGLVDADLRRQNQIRAVAKGSPVGLAMGLAGSALQGVGAFSLAGGKI